MRKLKRYIQNYWSLWRLQPRLKRLKEEIKRDLNLSCDLELKLAGNRGHDSNFLVFYDDKPFGVLRVLNPYKKRKMPASSMPYSLCDPSERIQYEYKIYTLGFHKNLTPTPLWCGTDAHMCAYSAYESLHEVLEKDYSKFWELSFQAAKFITQLHNNNIIHMDMSFNNILTDGTDFIFIDFEYKPSKNISLEQAKLYDYMRLLESEWKFIPDDIKNNKQKQEKWTSDLDDLSDVSQLKPGLERIFSAFFK